MSAKKIPGSSMIGQQGVNLIERRDPAPSEADR